MSKILCIIDGMTDHGFSPAEYENLSKMKYAGERDTCCGCEPETLTCVLHILGAEAVPANLRGYAEALGAGVPTGETDLILRGSRYSLKENAELVAPLPNAEKAPIKLNDENGKTYCNFYPIGDYRSIFVFPGKAGSIEKLRTFPPSRGFASAQRPEGVEAVARAFDFFRQNDSCIALWGESRECEVKRNAALFPAGKTAVITATTVVRGIAKLLDFDIIDVPGATGDVDTDLRAKTEAALAAAEKFENVVLHINGADEASHRKNPAEKKAFLGKVDREVIAALLASEHKIEVVSDHGTDPSTGVHTGEKQPVFRNFD